MSKSNIKKFINLCLTLYSWSFQASQLYELLNPEDMGKNLSKFLTKNTLQLYPFDFWNLVQDLKSTILPTLDAAQISKNLCDCSYADEVVYIVEHLKSINSLLAYDVLSYVDIKMLANMLIHEQTSRIDTVSCLLTIYNANREIGKKLCGFPELREWYYLYKFEVENATNSGYYLDDLFLASKYNNSLMQKSMRIFKVNEIVTKTIVLKSNDAMSSNDVFHALTKGYPDFRHNAKFMNINENAKVLKRINDINLLFSCLNEIIETTPLLRTRLFEAISLDYLAHRLSMQPNIWVVGYNIKEVWKHDHCLAEKLCQRLYFKKIAGSVTATERPNTITISIDYISTVDDTVAKNILDKVDIEKLASILSNAPRRNDVESCIQKIEEINERVANRLRDCPELTKYFNQ